MKNLVLCSTLRRSVEQWKISGFEWSHFDAHKDNPSTDMERKRNIERWWFHAIAQNVTGHWNFYCLTLDGGIEANNTDIFFLLIKHNFYRNNPIQQRQTSEKILRRWICRLFTQQRFTQQWFRFVLFHSDCGMHIYTQRYVYKKKKNQKEREKTWHDDSRLVRFFFFYD